MKPAEARSARERVLFQLKSFGPQSASQLASRLGVTPMAVRQHLQALVAESLVAFTDERRKVGRPARVWSLTPDAAKRFPDTHGDLTVDLIGSIRSTFGEEGLDRLLAERSRKQLATYEERMPAKSAALEKRVAALASIRSDEGYMAEWAPDEGGAFTLAENHCPICAAASVCQGFCRDELAMFQGLLGSDVTVTRGDHLLAGARRCTYRIEPMPSGRKENA